jgi:S1-C subfamily serine protease
VDDTQNATIERVDPDSEGERAGFIGGDRVMSVDGKPVYNYARLMGIIRSYPENSALEFVLERAGKPVKLNIKLPRMALPPGVTYSTPLGAKLQQREKGEGVRVMQIDRNSPAEKAGLLVGDIITTVDGQPPTIEWHDLVLSKKPGQRIELQVKRSGPSGNSDKTLTVTVGQ